jgi:HEAT repeat protein
MVRAAAVRALGALRATTAQAEFLRLLGDPEPAVRQAALFGAAQAGLRPLAPKMIELLGDGDADVRRAAAAAAGVLGDGLAVPALLRAFPEAPPDLRETITTAVTRLDLGAAPALIEALLQSPNVGSKIAVTRTLARLRLPGSVDVLARLSDHPEPAVRGAAIEALGRCTRADGSARESRLRAVAPALGDSDEYVRARAIDAAVRLGIDDAGRTIAGLLATDPSATVRERAALAIGILHLPGGEGPLIAACRPTEPTNVRLPWQPERSTRTASSCACWRCRTKGRCASCSASG